ncbi:MAG: ATP-dependent Clp protease ATP-binding subunit ClpC, partial [Kosmotogaceae bacterium]
SNLGGEFINKTKSSIGFVESTQSEKEYEAMKTSVLEEVKRTFRPEFLNRLDEIVVFHQLTKDQIKVIIDILMRDMRKRLKEKNLELSLSDKAQDFLVEEGFNPVYGARPLKRALQKYVEDPLSEELLRGRFREGDVINVEVKNRTLVFARERDEKAEVNAAT